MSETRVIKVAVLVTADVREKDLCRVLDIAFEDWDAVLQFTVEGYGWSGHPDATEADLMGALVDHTAERLREDTDEEV
jgi:hypothetical protein